MKKKWNLYNISESRGILMGFATLIVAFFHCYSFHFTKIFKSQVVGQLFDFIRKTGNVGVDIFLFLSAIGLYFSFSKNSNIKSFYKKRLLRILPAVIIVAIIYYSYLKVKIGVFIQNILLISLFTRGNRDLWYFSLIIILYFLYPFIHKIIDKKDIKGLLGMLLTIFGLTILLYNIDYSFYQKIEIALTRIPVFLIGVYVGKNVYNKKEIPSYLMIINFIVLITSLLLIYKGGYKYYIVVRYLYCLLGISIVFMISFIHTYLKNKIVDKFLTFIGKYSMEVYLIFEHLCLEVRKVITVNSNFGFYFIMFIVTLALSFLLSKLCDLIIKLIEGKKEVKAN